MGVWGGVSGRGEGEESSDCKIDRLNFVVQQVSDEG